MERQGSQIEASNIVRRNIVEEDQNNAQKQIYVKYQQKELRLHTRWAAR